MCELPPVELRKRVGSQVTDDTFLAIGRDCVADLRKAIPFYRNYPDALDFGCGCGRMLRHLVKTFCASNWYACDPDAEAVRWVAAAMPKVTAFVIRPDGHIPMPDDSVDLVVAVSVFSHLREWSTVLMNMRRILRPKGVLAMSYLGKAVYERKGLPYTDLKEPLVEAMDYCAANPGYINTYCPEGWARGEVGRFLRVLSDQPAGLAGYQDLLVAEQPG